MTGAPQRWTFDDLLKAISSPSARWAAGRSPGGNCQALPIRAAVAVEWGHGRTTGVLPFRWRFVSERKSMSILDETAALVASTRYKLRFLK